MVALVTQHTRRVDNMELDALCTQPAREPEAISAGLECNDDALDFATSLDRLLLPPVQ
jgi:hypothetical protein